MEKIFLIGFMASGKTTIGSVLADVMSWKFYDTDAVVEKEAGLTIPDIFKRHGESWFRRLEASVLARLCTGGSRMVVATGGGLPVFEGNLAMMKESGMVVFLSSSINVILERLRRDAEASSRPLARTEQQLRELYEERMPWYRQAHLSVDVDGRTPFDVALEIKRLVV